MPPLNPNLSSSVQDKSQEGSKSSSSETAQVNTAKSKSTNYTEEINANLVQFPNEEESFHLPEPVSKLDVIDKFITKSAQSKSSLYQYIAQGDFSIVWPNAIVFALGHILHFYSLYVILTDSDIRTHYTWIWSK